VPTPEDKARENIDRLLINAGWAVRDQSDANIFAHRGVAIRNFLLKTAALSREKYTAYGNQR
jgi:type I restriction enzyme R subunit